MADKGLFAESEKDSMLSKLGKRLGNLLFEELPAEAIAMTVLFWLTGKSKQAVFTGKGEEKKPILDLRGELLADLVSAVPKKNDSRLWNYLLKKAANKTDNGIITQLIKVPVPARKIFFRFLNKLENEEEIDYVVELLRHDKIKQLFLQALRWAGPKWGELIAKFDTQHGTKVMQWVVGQGKDVHSVLLRVVSEVKKKQKHAHKSSKKQKRLFRLSFTLWWPVWSR